jgi:hypothetical protein
MKMMLTRRLQLLLIARAREVSFRVWIKSEQRRSHTRSPFCVIVDWYR